jgi:exopolysaccharide biosynthesis polyprenyl glycosylphosphotransferase
VLAGSYDARFVAAGMEPYRRIVNAAAWLLAVITFTAFAAHADVSRGLVLASMPYIAFLTIVERYALRQWLQHHLAGGWSTHRVVAVGSSVELCDLVDHMRRAPHAGFHVVAAVTPGELTDPQLPEGVVWAGSSLDGVVATLTILGADTLALAGSHFLPRGGLRRLSWDLEGTNVDLVVAPSMTDIAGPRIRIRPVEGLPLLHIERPQFSRVQLALKSSIDRIVAASLIILMCPVLIACAVGVRLSSRGPVMYRQVRLGLNGAHFIMLKFRSMRLGSDAGRTTIADLNEVDGALFKIRRDPRVTRFGRFMRRWSLDELPQLLNVLHGSMSLVGPRPLPVADIERFGGDARRRILVKPGITGLWQVSGRSDLSWEESLRLDLHYVDHWSLGLDFVLLWRTLLTVLRGRGAY